MNGSPSGKWGKFESLKLANVAIFLVSSGVLTQITSFVTNTDFGKYTPLVMAGWNLLLAFIVFLAKNNTPKEDLPNAP